MDCRACTALITPALDGELADARVRTVKQHIAACPACARRWRRLAQARAAFASLPPEDATPGFDERLVARLRHDPPTRRWLLPAAAAAVVAVIGVLSMERGRRPPAPGEARTAVGRDILVPLGIDAGLRELGIAADCGAPGAKTCRVVTSPCDSPATCGRPAGESEG